MASKISQSKKSIIHAGTRQLATTADVKVLAPTKPTTKAGNRKAASRAATFDAPAGAIDLNKLADLLAARLQPQAAAQAGVSGQVEASYQASGSVGTASNYSGSALMQAYDSRPLCGGQKSLPPIDSEINQMSLNLETVHTLITDLFNELDPMLAHEDAVDKEESCKPTRSSESPLHRRLIDRNETLETIIARLHHLKSRIRN